jgi:hypothetical protein
MISWKEKRKLYATKKAACVNCKRPVGNIFQTLVEKAQRELIARCGDKKEPCPFYIHLKVGDFYLLDKSLQEYKNDIEGLKKKIIMEKNDMMFQYIPSEQAVTQFEEIKSSIEEKVKLHEYLFEIYQGTIFPEERLQNEKTGEMRYYESIAVVKNMIKEFETSKNVQFIRDAVELYEREIGPRWKKWMENEYVYMAVEENERENVFQLLQVPFSESIYLLEYDLGEVEVVRFVTGVPKKTQRVKSVFSSSNSSIEDDISESEAEDSDEEDEEEEESEEEEDEEEEEEEEEEDEEDDDDDYSDSEDSSSD